MAADATVSEQKNSEPLQVANDATGIGLWPSCNENDTTLLARGGECPPLNAHW